MATRSRNFCSKKDGSQRLAETTSGPPTTYGFRTRPRWPNSKRPSIGSSVRSKRWATSSARGASDFEFRPLAGIELAFEAFDVSRGECEVSRLRMVEDHG